MKGTRGGRDEPWGFHLQINTGIHTNTQRAQEETEGGSRTPMEVLCGCRAGADAGETRSARAVAEEDGVDAEQLGARGGAPRAATANSRAGRWQWRRWSWVPEEERHQGVAAARDGGSGAAKPGRGTRGRAAAARSRSGRQQAVERSRVWSKGGAGASWGGRRQRQQLGAGSSGSRAGRCKEAAEAAGRQVGDAASGLGDGGARQQVEAGGAGGAELGGGGRSQIGRAHV